MATIDPKKMAEDLTKNPVVLRGPSVGRVGSFSPSQTPGQKARIQEGPEVR